MPGRESRMKANPHYQNVFNAQYSRKYGGTEPGTADPYIQGYIFVYFTEFAKTLNTAIKNQQLGTSNEFLVHNDAVNSGATADMLSGACIAATLPGGTLNKETFNGIGNSKWSVPSYVDWGDSFSLTYNEYQGTPISRLHHYWIKMMRDPTHGVSELEDYTKRNYASTIYIWTTEPNTLDIEKAYCMTGVYPLTDPLDQFGSGVANIGKLELTIDYSFDHMWNGDTHGWVFKKAEELLTSIRETGKFVDIGHPIEQGSDTETRNYVLDKVLNSHKGITE